MDRAELLKEAVSRWGKESQSFKAIEEMAELTKALSKAYRKPEKDQILNVLEEIADVRIMLDQMQIIYEPLCYEAGMAYTIANEEENKLSRLAYILGVTYSPTTQFDGDHVHEARAAQGGLNG